MVVFYTASYYGKDKYQKWFDIVRHTIEKFNVQLISPEVGNYMDVLKPEERKTITDPKLLHYEAIKQSIHISDVVVIEISHEDFQLGHEATLAIMDKKPVLCLSIHDDFSKRNNNEYFFGAKYNERNIEGIIQDFFAKARELRHAKRFNMFLYPTQLAHLEKAGKHYGMNMSEYIRRLINLDRRSNQEEQSAIG